MPFDDADIAKSYLKAYGVAAVGAETTRELEEQGPIVWLKTLFPFAFEEEFSDDHKKFWKLYWSVLMRIREQMKYIKLGLPVPDKFYIHPKEYVTFLILGRGLAKSSTVEASSVMRGAILGGCYSVYICEAQDQANEHVGNCRSLIEHEQSRLTEYYPEMTVDPNAKLDGKRIKDREDLFMTTGGYICRAKGLKARLRGLRIGTRRPDDINVDDIDGVNDSIDVSIKKLKDLTASVTPIQARRWTTIKFAQNLILEHGVMNQIHTGKSDAFAERTVIGVTNAFVEFREGIEYQTYLDEEEGRVKHRILAAAIPTWAGVDTEAAQKFLNDSGLETFLAEYMNSFEHLKMGKVFAFDEERHLITWDMVKSKFGVAYIPAIWQAKASADFGYSDQSLSAWLFTARAAQNSPEDVRGRYFGYRSKTFMYDSIDDQAVAIWEDMFPDFSIGKNHFEARQAFVKYPELERLLRTKPKCKPLLDNYTYDAKLNQWEKLPEFARDADEQEKALFYVKQAEQTYSGQVTMWSVSHEKTGEQKTLAQKYGIPAQKVKRFEADAGVVEANHLLRGDMTMPHPFKEDTFDDDSGLWRLGSPYIFFIVERIEAPRDDRDFKTFREHVGAQRWTVEKLTEKGLTQTIPMKYKSDHCDAFRIFATDYQMPAETQKTVHQRFLEKLEEVGVQPIEKDEVITPERQMEMQQAQEIANYELQRELGLIDDDDEDEYGY